MLAPIEHHTETSFHADSVQVDLCSRVGAEPQYMHAPARPSGVPPGSENLFAQLKTPKHHTMSHEPATCLSAHQPTHLHTPPRLIYTCPGLKLQNHWAQICICPNGMTTGQTHQPPKRSHGTYKSLAPSPNPHHCLHTNSHPPPDGPRSHAMQC